MPIFTKVYLAADHAGFALKAALVKHLSIHYSVEVVDLGTDSETSVDYPDYAALLAPRIKGSDTAGILICGSGVGMSMAANRFPHIRAALCCDPKVTEMARAHNDANVLVLGARYIAPDTAIACLEAFLSATFEGGRHQVRLDKLKGD